MHVNIYLNEQKTVCSLYSSIILIILYFGWYDDLMHLYAIVIKMIKQGYEPLNKFKKQTNKLLLYFNIIFVWLFRNGEMLNAMYN